MAICKECAAPLADADNFCPVCGARAAIDHGPQAATANLRAEIKAALKDHLKDTKSLELETAEAIVARVSAWAKLFAFFVAVPLGLLLAWFAMLGWSSYADFSKNVSSAKTAAVAEIQSTHNAILGDVRGQAQKAKDDASSQLANLRTTSERIIKEAEGRARQLQADTADMTARYQSLKTELANAAKLADEVKQLTNKVNRLEDLLTEEQSRRVRSLISIFEAGKVQPDYGYLVVLPGDASGLTYGANFSSRGSGALHQLVEGYVRMPDARHRSEFEPFLKQLQERDPKLDTLPQFHALLKKAAVDPVMQHAQDEWFSQKYFQPALRIAKQLGVRSPLGIAVILDSNVHGSWSTLRDRTNTSLGGTPLTGVNEMTWIKTYLQTRVDWMNNHPNQILRLSATRPKALLDLAEQGNFDLRPPLIVRGVKVEK